MSRECGSCSACCTALTIEVLNKPQGTPCRHLRVMQGHGCSVYETRPTVCRRYQCLYLKGFGYEHSDRPDVTGILLTAPCEHRGPIQITETQEGALDRAHTRGLLQRLFEQGDFGIVTNTGAVLFSEMARASKKNAKRYCEKRASREGLLGHPPRIRSGA
jgi:Fe-S-cluster containining protein